MIQAHIGSFDFHSPWLPSLMTYDRAIWKCQELDRSARWCPWVYTPTYTEDQIVIMLWLACTQDYLRMITSTTWVYCCVFSSQRRITDRLNRWVHWIVGELVWKLQFVLDLVPVMEWNTTLLSLLKGGTLSKQVFLKGLCSYILKNVEYGGRIVFTWPSCWIARTHVCPRKIISLCFCCAAQLCCLCNQLFYWTPRYL